VLAALEAAGLRGELDARSESVGRKIRDAELRKLPYMLVLGEREAASGTVAVRERSAGDVGVVALEEFVARLRSESTQRSR
jgi:threonyl-tRNA synthetase